MSDLHPLEKYFNIEFKNKDLLKTALTHSSYSNENNCENNERLEFVGDAVVDLLVGEYLFKTLKGQEGELTKKRANIVCEKSLSYFASLFHLENYLLLGKGEEKTGGRNKPTVKSDAFEAFIGAIYIDQGLNACKKVINKVVIPNIDHAYEETIDYKTILQEHVQSFKSILRYEIVSETGQPHNKTFKVRVIMDNDIILGEGVGSSHHHAEQDAAKNALDKLAV